MIHENLINRRVSFLDSNAERCKGLILSVWDEDCSLFLAIVDEIGRPYVLEFAQVKFVDLDMRNLSKEEMELARQAPIEAIRDVRSRLGLRLIDAKKLVEDYLKVERENTHY